MLTRTQDQKHCVHVDYYSPVLAPPSSATVVTFILAALGSRSMAFVGDSMMYQTAVGFECAALCEAEGWAIEKHTEKRREKVRERGLQSITCTCASFANANALYRFQTPEKVALRHR